MKKTIESWSFAKLSRRDSTKRQANSLALLAAVSLALIAALASCNKAPSSFFGRNDGMSEHVSMPGASPFTGSRPQYSTFTALGPIRTTTKDTPAYSYSVVVDMVIGYDLDDNTTATELTGRLYELRDFVRQFFKSKTAEELRPENEPRLKQEIIEQLNTRILNSGRTRIILFNQLDVIEMEPETTEDTVFP